MRVRTLESTSQNMSLACCSGMPCASKYLVIVSATPTPDEPAPKKRMRWSRRGSPVIWKARIAPARMTAPVPWMSGLGVSNHAPERSKTDRR